MTKELFLILIFLEQLYFKKMYKSDDFDVEYFLFRKFILMK